MISREDAKIAKKNKGLDLSVITRIREIISARKHYPHVATPEGRVHFAGEHTASLALHGLMQGALESGMRAAHEVNDAL